MTLGRAAALVALLGAVPAAALAQPRGSEVATRAVELSLPVAARFAGTSVPAGSYRVSLTEAGLTLTDATSMVQVATLPVQRATVKSAVKEPSASCKTHGKQVEIVLLARDEVFTVRGERQEEKPKAEGSKVDLEKDKAEAKLDAPAGDAPPSDLALVEAALKRFEPEVLPCAEKAQRGRWPTDDARFAKCVCPIAQRWRLPKVTAPLRLHRFLTKGKSGYSLTISPEGKASACRVWAGPRSPEEKAAEEQNRQP